MEQITPIPAFQDNYIWLLRNDAGSHAIIVDPGDAAPVITALEREGLTLAAIFITHHHFDHIGGINELVAKYAAPVFGPANEQIPCRTHSLRENQVIQIEGFSQRFRIIEVPGHTLGHIAYFSEDFTPPILFCGDTLFSAGCGRLFEGSPAQMFDSLNKLAALPSQTRVCCTHEYTLSNLRFAQAVEPGNAEIEKHIDKVTQLRAINQPSLPTTIDQELTINPFLRSAELIIKQSASTKMGFEICEPVQIFATLRTWKNEF